MQRRAQKPTTIRSNYVAERLKVLTRDGRSQAAVIEDALRRVPDPSQVDQDAARLARIMELIEITSKAGLPSMAEFDAKEYDENGLPR